MSTGLAADRRRQRNARALLHQAVGDQALLEERRGHLSLAQLLHSRGIKRWASTKLIECPIRERGAPRLSKRCSTVIASLAWIEVKSRWPVSAASSEINAVSASAGLTHHDHVGILAHQAAQYAGEKSTA